MIGWAGSFRCQCPQSSPVLRLCRSANCATFRPAGSVAEEWRNSWHRWHFQSGWRPPDEAHSGSRATDCARDNAVLHGSVCVSGHGTIGFRLFGMERGKTHRGTVKNFRIFAIWVERKCNTPMRWRATACGGMPKSGERKIIGTGTMSTEPDSVNGARQLLVGPLAAHSPGLGLARAFEVQSLEIERYGGTNEVLQGRFIYLVVVVDVDGATDISVEAGVE